MQSLMDDIQKFEEWSGQLDNGETLLIVPEPEPVHYLVFWDTSNGKMQSVKDLVYERTLVTKDTIKVHLLDPKQTISVSSVKTVGNFRYLVVVTP